MSETREAISIEVACDMPDGVELVVCQVAPGSRVVDVLERAPLPARRAPAQWPPAAVGIHGRLVDLNRIVLPGDRLEIYRPLQADPKLARRQRVKRERRLPKPPTR